MTLCGLQLAVHITMMKVFTENLISADLPKREPHFGICRIAQKYFQMITTCVCIYLSYPPGQARPARRASRSSEPRPHEREEHVRTSPADGRRPTISSRLHRCCSQGPADPSRRCSLQSSASGATRRNLRARLYFRN